MERLTKKEANCLSTNGYHRSEYLLNGTPRYKAIDKLGQKEDDDEELGIDSHILFKALKQGYIYVREHNTEEKEIVCEGIRLNFFNKTLDFVEPRKEIGKGRNLFQFGKTWALTKEELEND